MAFLSGDPLTVFGATAALMFLGFAGNLIFTRLRINDTLILIGVLLGPGTQIIPAASVEPVRALVCTGARQKTDGEDAVDKITAELSSLGLLF